ncbi:MAG: hypothetical protein ACJ77E_04100, partial [Gaiellaceae bacterium]
RARVPAVDSASAALLACSGAAVAGTTLFADRLEWPARNVEFARNGSFLLFVFLIVGQVAVWPVAIAWLWDDLRALARGWRRNARELVESLAIVAVASWAGLLAASFGPRIPEYLPHHREKLLLISGLGWVAGSIAASGIWLLHGEMQELLARPAPGPRELEEVLALRDRLQRFLTVSGSIIGLAILGAGAERNMISAYTAEFHVKGGFPIEYVLIFGLFFSALLALVYFPSHLTLLALSARLRDRYAPVPDLDPDGAWIDGWKRRGALEDALSMKVGASGSFKTGVAVLTPLIGSLTGLLLNVHG